MRRSLVGDRPSLGPGWLLLGRELPFVLTRFAAGAVFFFAMDQSATMLAQRYSRCLAAVTPGTNLPRRGWRATPLALSSEHRWNSPTTHLASPPTASDSKTRRRNFARLKWRLQRYQFPALVLSAARSPAST